MLLTIRRLQRGLRPNKHSRTSLYIRQHQLETEAGWNEIQQARLGIAVALSGASVKIGKLETEERRRYMRAELRGAAEIEIPVPECWANAGDPSLQ